MANMGDRVSVGDREGVIVRSVNTPEGVELTVRVPDNQDTLDDYELPYDPHALILDGHGGAVRGVEFDNTSVEDALAKNNEVRARHEDDAETGEKRREDRLRATAAPAANEGDKRRDDKLAATKPAATKAADRKAGDTK